MAQRRPLGAATTPPKSIVAELSKDAPGTSDKTQPAAEVKFTAMIDPNLFRRMKVHCANKGLKIKGFIQHAIERQLAESSDQ